MTSRNPSSPPRLSSSHAAETISRPLYIYTVSRPPLYLFERLPLLLFDDGYKLRVWYGGCGYIRSPSLDRRHRPLVWVCVYLYI